MGFTGLARWQNAPTTGLDLVRDNILHNHQGMIIGRWVIQMKAYRSAFLATPGTIAPPERAMCTLTMGENTFVLIEDPGAPSWREIMALQAQQQQAQLAVQSQATSDASAPAAAAAPPQTSMPMHHFRPPPHYSMNLYTVKSPGALEHMLGQLRSRWTSIRQGAQAGRADAQKGGGVHITVDGSIFKVGLDWIVRVGNVVLAGGAIKGLLVEAEYLPVPILPTNEDGGSDLLSNFLASIVPNVPDARTSAMSIHNEQWEEVLHHRFGPSPPNGATGPATTPLDASDIQDVAAVAAEEPVDADADDDDDTDLYDYPGKTSINAANRGDWTGVERDRRSSFLVWAALKSEGLL